MNNKQERRMMSEEKSILQIDEYNLDIEWKNQPTAYFDMATKLAEAKAELDISKTEFDVLKAKISMDVRSNPDSYGLDKLTESTVSNAVVCQEEYIITYERINKAKHKVDLLQAAVVALDHKKKALENLVSLHGQKYFSEPHANHDTSEVLDDMTKTRIRTMRNQTSNS
jgi:hypothetical protein